MRKIAALLSVCYGSPALICVKTIAAHISIRGCFRGESVSEESVPLGDRHPDDRRVGLDVLSLLPLPDQKIQTDRWRTIAIQGSAHLQKTH